MTSELSDFAARLCATISSGSHCFVNDPTDQDRHEALPSKSAEMTFNRFALELFALQFKYNAAYQTICKARCLTPEVVESWPEIPAVPTAAFKELELSCIPPNERVAVFHSSGTTEQKPSRHFHSRDSLKVYETALLSWFFANVQSDIRFTTCDLRLICLTPPPVQVPHSSLVHMFETICSRAGKSAGRTFFGNVAGDGPWVVDFDAMVTALKSAIDNRQSAILLGTAFSFVHLLDFLRQHDLRFQLVPGSRVMETGGYKNRSRAMPKEELHALMADWLGIPAENIISEYGMSELSSQAYDGRTALPRGQEFCGRAAARPYRAFHFPPWARVQIVSPETGREVADGEAGILRVFDLANVFSVMAVQTEDLGIRHGDGFESIGRAPLAEARGCSLMMEGNTLLNP